MLIDPPLDAWYPQKERRRRVRVARTTGSSPSTALTIVSTTRKRDAATVHALQAYLQTRSGPSVRKTIDLDL